MRKKRKEDITEDESRYKNLKENRRQRRGRGSVSMMCVKVHVTFVGERQYHLVVQS
jgi:hypothetical protein